MLAGAIGFGVVYNSARIALSERGRELASLRVLGFTRGEIAYILLGELALLTLAAIPVGFLVGVGLVGILVLAFESELYRLPLLLTPENYAMGASGRHRLRAALRPAAVAPPRPAGPGGGFEDTRIGNDNSMQLRAKIGMCALPRVVAAGLVLGFMPRAVPVDVADGDARAARR